MMLVGRLFHARATVTRNDRSQMVLSRVRGTIRRGQEPDRSRCRDSEAGTSSVDSAPDTYHQPAPSTKTNMENSDQLCAADEATDPTVYTLMKWMTAVTGSLGKSTQWLAKFSAFHLLQRPHERVLVQLEKISSK